MKYLFHHWVSLEKEITGKYVLLMLDYDGTLVPLARKPDQALLPPQSKKLLQQLSQNSNCEVIIISGRTLCDIKRMVGLRNIIYSGNHGLEVEGPKIKFQSFIPLRYKKILKKIKKQLQEELSGVAGAWVEDKGPILSVHYRLVAPEKIPTVKTIFQENTMVDRLCGDIKTKSGKMILEIKPPVVWDKGKVVLWLLARQTFLQESQGILPVYMGDDVTDEDAFRALHNKGWTISVGQSKNSAAQYYLNNPQEISKFLQEILEATSKSRKICHSRTF